MRRGKAKKYKTNSWVQSVRAVVAPLAFLAVISNCGLPGAICLLPITKKLEQEQLWMFLGALFYRLLLFLVSTISLF